MNAPILLCLLALPQNRLWFVELELRGPCEGVSVDCGSDGRTYVDGPFASGESRRLTVPVPVHSPLGSSGLGLLPPPIPSLIGPEAGAHVKFKEWSRTQPDEHLIALRERHPVRPPTTLGALHARSHECWLALASLALLWRLRTRTRWCFLAALAASGGTFAVTYLRQPDRSSTRILEWEDGQPGLWVESAVGELSLPAGGLETYPEGRALEMRWSKEGKGLARASSAELLGFWRGPQPTLDRGTGPSEALEAVWTREPMGAWSFHGTWEAGRPLGPVLRDSPGPPGWLAIGIGADRRVLVARTRVGIFWRCLGFDAGDG
jgi:hypothetical protein